MLCSSISCNISLLIQRNSIKKDELLIWTLKRYSRNCFYRYEPFHQAVISESLFIMIPTFYNYNDNYPKIPEAGYFIKEKGFF